MKAWGLIKKILGTGKEDGGQDEDLPIVRDGVLVEGGNQAEKEETAHEARGRLEKELRQEGGKIEKIEQTEDSKHISDDSSETISQENTNEEINETEKSTIRKGRLPSEKKLVTEYLDQISAQGYSKETVREYRLDLNLICEYSREEVKRHPLKLSLAQIEKYIVWLANERKNKSAIIRRRLSSFASFVKWTAKRNLPTPPINAVDRPKAKRSLPKHIGNQKFLEIREEIRISAKQDIETAWAGCMLLAGLRVSEIKTIRVIDGMLEVRGKGDKERLVHAPTWLIEAVAMHIEANPKLWKADRRVIWRRIKERWGVHPHQFRHSYATQLIRRGVPIDELRKYLGHTDIGTTVIYADTKVSNKGARLIDG